MPIKRINEFPEGSGSLSNDDVFLFMDDPSGSGITKKISLSDISNAIGGGGSGNPFDQNLNTTDFPTFSGVNLTNNSSLSEGSFDNGNGGNGGISLNCGIGYELNWQAGHLKNTYNNGNDTSSILIDSPIEFPIPCSLLLNFDGNNNDTTTYDSSFNNFTVTLSDTIISTTKSVFGGSSAFFNGSPSIATVADSTAFGFGTEDFTIEMFVYPNLNSSNRGSVISVGSYQNGILWRIGNVPDNLYFNANETQTYYNWNPNANLVPNDVWSHIALTRQNTIVRVFVNGQKVYQQDIGVVNLGYSKPLTIGCGSHELTTTDSYIGYIDDLRIVKGAAAYIQNFIPPSSPLSNNQPNKLKIDSTSITFPDGSRQISAHVAPRVVDLGSISGTINTNASLGDIFDLTLASSGLLSSPTNGVDGQTLRWRITYAASGLPLTLGNNFRIPNSASSPLPFSSASGLTDLLGATYDASRNKWDIIAFVPGY